MHIVTIILIIACVKSVSTQTSELTEVSQKAESIVGGVEAQISDYPFMASLQVRHQHFCGATILSPRWLLTAAHCIENPLIKASSLIYAVAGLSDCKDLEDLNKQIRAIESRHVHRAYWEMILKNDIAVLKVVQPFEFNDNVKPVSLGTRTKNKNRNIWDIYHECIVVGWGMNGTFIRPPICPLRMTVIALLSLNDCRKLVLRLGLMYKISRKVICTWYPLNLRDVFIGDSGGPLLCGNPGHFLQQGIISHGINKFGGPKFFTRIEKYEKWIMNTAGANIKSICQILIFSVIFIDYIKYSNF